MIVGFKMVFYQIAAVLLFFILIFPSFSFGAKRVALVIGNSNYKSGGALENPINDAEDMLEALSALGFEVICRIDASEKEMEYAIERFSMKIEKDNEIAFFYYAGHAMQIKGRNYLIPVNSNIKNDIDVKTDAVDVEKILARMNDTDNFLNIIVLDACRNNPFKSSVRAFRKGLAQMESRAGTILCYATAPGQVAADGGLKNNYKSRNSIYTGHLLKHIRNAEFSVTKVFDKTGLAVVEETDGKQTPVVLKYPIKEIYLAKKTEQVVSFQRSKKMADLKSEIDIISRPEQGRIYLNGKNVGTTPLKLKNLRPGDYDIRVVSEGYITEQRKLKLSKKEKAIISFYLAQKENQKPATQVYQSKPTGKKSTKSAEKPKPKKVKFKIVPTPANAKLSFVFPKMNYRHGMKLSPGRYQVRAVRKGYQSKTVWISVPSSGREEKTVKLKMNPIPAGTTNEDAQTGIHFVWVPSGCFQMGCDTSDSGCGSDARPKHQVCVNGFWISKYETTQKLWIQMMEYNPSKLNSGNSFPIENISYQEVDIFIKRLNMKTGKKYRLPTEAEWEYAASSMGKDKIYPGSTNPDKIGWFKKNSRKRPHTVGEKMPNHLGIYDMGGNVWEWCLDTYKKDAYKNHKKKNPKILSDGKNKIVRGGGWYSSKDDLMLKKRNYINMYKRNYDIGFRLVKEY